MLGNDYFFNPMFNIVFQFFYYSVSLRKILNFIRIMFVGSDDFDYYYPRTYGRTYVHTYS